MNTEHDKTLREQLAKALEGEQSHITFEAAMADFPVKLAGKKPGAAPHSAWELLEHLRIAQHDILEFSRNVKHESPKWPEGYWPGTEAPANAGDWEASVAAFRQDAKAMEALIAGSESDLHKSIEGGDGQTLLREALVLAAHNSYHLGQLMFLKKMLVGA